MLPGKFQPSLVSRGGVKAERNIFQTQLLRQIIAIAIDITDIFEPADAQSRGKA